LATSERRKSKRVNFERGFGMTIMSIDGTWRRECIMEEVSEDGTRLAVEGSLDKLAQTKEFFLLLSSTGLAFRRCEMAWISGDRVGATFITQSGKDKPVAQSPDDVAEA
jgi:hypothetical protein